MKHAVLLAFDGLYPPGKTWITVRSLRI